MVKCRSRRRRRRSRRLSKEHRTLGGSHHDHPPCLLNATCGRSSWRLVFEFRVPSHRSSNAQKEAQSIHISLCTCRCEAGDNGYSSRRSVVAQTAFGSPWLCGAESETGRGDKAWPYTLNHSSLFTTASRQAPRFQLWSDKSLLEWIS